MAAFTTCSPLSSFSCPSQMKYTHSMATSRVRIGQFFGNNLSRHSRHSPAIRCNGITNSAASAPEAKTLTRPVSVIRKLEKLLKSRDLTAVQLTEQYLNNLSSNENVLGSFLHIAHDRALEQAAAIDAMRSSGQELGPLAGIPLAAKDNLCTADMPSTAGSRVLDGYRPPYDATAIHRLRSAGGIFLGKTNMDEFGMGSSTESSGYKVTSNPWDLSRVPGGSSGGSGAAVAANQCVAALGSDTGGSVRQPASFCGVVGLKPTYGLVSRYGLMAYASSLDVIGCLAASVEDAGILLTAMAGIDEKDATCSSRPVDNLLAALEPSEKFLSRPLAGIRFGIIKETMGQGVDDDVATAVREAALHLEQLGASVDEVSLPSFEYGLPAYYVLAPSEASSNLARYDGVRYGPRAKAEDLTSLYSESRAAGFGPEVKRRILMGTYALSAGYYDAFYKRAQQVRTLIQNDFSESLKVYHALIAPTCPTTAYKKGEKISDPLALYAGDLMTVNVNLAGLPAVSVPCGLSNKGPHGLPIGLQFIGRAFGEVDLLKYAHVFEQTTPSWSHLCPTIAPK